MTWLKEIQLEIIDAPCQWIFDDVSDDTVDEITETGIQTIDLVVRIDDEGWFDVGLHAEEVMSELIDQFDIVLVGNDRHQVTENIKQEINRVVNEEN